MKNTNTNIKTYVKPFLKWAGGKRQLLKQFEDIYPEKLKLDDIDTYIEPFLGGGAVFFELIQNFNFKKIVLNDVNEELMLSYKIIQKRVNELVERLEILHNQYMKATAEEKKDMYYKIRNEFNKEKTQMKNCEINSFSVKHVSKLIFLNKTCFNGLYRENSKGEFNVPQGRYKNPSILDEDNLRNVNEVLQNVTLITGDFENIEKYISGNTFIYMDPPYRPLPKTKSFTNYSKDNFNEDSQIRLSRFYKKLSDMGVLIMLSNSNPKNTDSEDNFFQKHYSDFEIIEVTALRTINSKAKKRGEVTELVISNS